MDYFRIEHIEILLGIFTLLVTTYLGVVVFINDRGSWTARLFFILSLLIDAYVVVNYLSLHPPHVTPENQLFWIRIVMFVCSFIGPALLLLVGVFPGREFKLKKHYLFPLFTLMLASAGASLSSLVFKAIDFSTGEPLPIPGPGILIFFIDFVGLFILSSIVLIFKYRRSSGKEKVQNFYFILGVIATFSFMAISTVIFVVILKTSATVFLGPLSSVMLMLFIAYAIFKYKLFDIKVILTETLVVALVIILLSEGVTSGSFGGILFKFFFAILVAVIGISLVKSVRKEIIQKNELAKLAESLETANLQLQELDKQKTDFLSIAAHQLRTPLSIANGYIELLEDDAYGHLPAESKGILRNMDESNQRLVKLVDEFLDITRIEQGRTTYNFKPSQINTVAKSVSAELRDRAREHKLHLQIHFEKLPAIVLDEDKVRQVIFNFVDNAIKYSETGTISIVAQEENDGIALRVIDEGVGFDKVDAANFFQKFYRGNNVKGTNVTGTGLGLYVCRMFIEAHHGRVWSKSPGFGQGSEFGFWLPFNQTAVSQSTV